MVDEFKDWHENHAVVEQNLSGFDEATKGMLRIDRLGEFVKPSAQAQRLKFFAKRRWQRSQADFKVLNCLMGFRSPGEISLKTLEPVCVACREPVVVVENHVAILE